MGSHEEGFIDVLQQNPLRYVFYNVGNITFLFSRVFLSCWDTLQLDHLNSIRFSFIPVRLKCVSVRDVSF